MPSPTFSDYLRARSREHTAWAEALTLTVEADALCAACGRGSRPKAVRTILLNDVADHRRDAENFLKQADAYDAAELRKHTNKDKP